MVPDDRPNDPPRGAPPAPPAGPSGQPQEKRFPHADVEPEETGRMKGLKRWARQNSPGFHRFLTSDEKPYPMAREVAVGAVVLLLAAGLLWGLTGQPLGDSPVVVIESGSMMHCDQGRETNSNQCEGSYGRLSTIDPGDLVFVRDIDGRDDVRTFAGEATCGPAELGDLDCGCESRRSYGACGDVIIYQPQGDARRTPIIHRALFWLEVHDDGTFSVPECGLDHVNRSELNNICLQSMGARRWSSDHSLDALGPEDSGFITRGDNNGQLDLPNISELPVRPEWILGKARGEVPWIGLVKLGVSDFASGCKVDARIPCNFDNAPPDVKTLMWVTVGVLVAAPFVVEKVQAYRHRNDEDE